MMASLKALKIRSLPNLLLLFTTLLFAACTLENQRTQSIAFSGFGGTGHSLQGDENNGSSGFGGTGHSGFGGTGIIGTISAFGSIWVNGVEVEYSANTPIQNPLGKKTALKLGQQVIVETQTGTQQPLAKRIQVFIPIAGKIQQRKGHQITVQNQVIILKEHTLLDKKIDLSPGNYIAISGYKIKQNQWLATRINQNPLHKSWFKPKIPLHFDHSVQQLILQPELIGVVQNLKKTQSLISEMQQEKIDTHHALKLQGKWQGNHFVPEKMDWIERHPQMTPLQHIKEPGESLKNPSEKMENIQEIREQNRQTKEMQDIHEQQQSLQNMQEIHEQQQSLQNMQDIHEQQQSLQNMQEIREQN